jgi:hypothetical protein
MDNVRDTLARNSAEIVFHRISFFRPEKSEYLAVLSPPTNRHSNGSDLNVQLLISALLSPVILVFENPCTHFPISPHLTHSGP